MSIVVATGGRAYEGDAEAEDQFKKVLQLVDAQVLRHGGCSGADEFADDVARRMRLIVEIYEADWSTYGRAAGPIRNRTMVNGADVLIAMPGGRGTADCIRAAKKAGLEVFHIGEPKPGAGP